MFRFVSACILILALFTACGQKTFEEKLASLYENTVPQISSDSLQKSLDSQEIMLLDTRSFSEYQVSHIPNARFIDYENHSSADFQKIPRDTEIIVYCTVGYRSERIGEELQKLGFSNVKNLYGGIFEWKNEKHDVVNQKGVITDSVHTYSKSWSQWLENGIKIYE